MQIRNNNIIKLIRDILVIVFVAFMLTVFAKPMLIGAMTGQVITITIGG